MDLLIRFQKLKQKIELLAKDNHAGKELLEDIELFEQQIAQHPSAHSDLELFIKLLAHDLRSEFNGMLGFLNLLLEQSANMDAKKNETLIKTTYEIAQRTYFLLEDVLICLKDRSSNSLIYPEQIEFNTVCNEVIKMTEPVASEKNITINNITRDNVVIQSNGTVLKAVLRNLVSNAIKFTRKKGQIYIEAVRNHSNVTITVTDNGVGMAPEKLAELFDNPYKTSTLGTEGEKGTGLGLHLCKELVIKQGGKIWVESEPVSGSKFKFSIPLTTDAPRAVPPSP
jgi:signal transduction histidine kinase